VATTGTTAGLVRRSAITDDNGGFVLLDLPPAVYTLTAYLPGFELYTREVAITAPGTLEIGATLRMGCLEDLVIVDQGVASALAEAEFVAHVRVVAVSRTRIDLGANCFNAQEYVADVLDVAKGASVAVTTRISFWRAGSAPRVPDNEFVVFLKRGPTGSLTQQASIVNFLYIFPVRAGRVSWPRKDLAGVADGVAVADLLAALRTL
jgi:hypothetical protein